MITVHALDPFKILYKLPPDTNLIVCIGGRTRGLKNIRGFKIHSILGNDQKKALRYSP